MSSQPTKFDRGENMAQAKSDAVVVHAIKPAKLTLAEVQTRLAGKKGRRFWTSLDELAEAPGFEELVREEFPRQASEWVDGVSRRNFLKVMGASLALAGMAGCTKQPDEPIYPYVKAPEDLILGKPMYFATAFPFPTGAVPVVIKTDAFRPIKIDGNPEHPASKGKTDLFTQASLLDLYDPDRSQHVMKQVAGEWIQSEFSEFAHVWMAAAQQTASGEGLYFLSETVLSPTFASQWKELQAAYPAARLVQYDPLHADGLRAATKATFGAYLDPQYRLEEADVILSLDADFLAGNSFPGFLPMAAAYAERHQYVEGKSMNRLYVVETMPSVTGYKAEHRLAIKPSEMEQFANALVHGGPLSDTAQVFLHAVLQDLKSAGRRAVVIAGPQASAAVHAAALVMNSSLGAIGTTVVYTDPVAALPSEQLADLKELVTSMRAGKVKALAILGGNPVYNAPADLAFAETLQHVPLVVHLGAYQDETGVNATWHLNQSHYLESWSDTRAADGTISIVQPLIDPLYGGISVHQVLQLLLENPVAPPQDVVRATAKSYLTGDFEAAWKKALHDGWVEGSALAPRTVLASSVTLPTVSTESGLELYFKSDPSLYDGRFGNNGWLQELPKQVTHLSWDNAALMSMETMSMLKVEETEQIEITLEGRKLVIPVLMVPGHAPNVITLHLGMGRSFGRVGRDVGSNGYVLRTSAAPVFHAGASIKKLDGYYDLCVTTVHSLDQRGKFAQSDLSHKTKPGSSESLGGHEAMERGVIRYATLAEAKKNPKFAHESDDGENFDSDHGAMLETPKKEDSFFPDAWDYKQKDKSGHVQNAWGMAIDLNSCIGCNACVVSCYAENNIPVVGREQVKIGRNMQWLRIDTYFEGDLHAPKAHFQPMLCQHCENAGCEQVCPVGATVHTPEGLNAMVYNRCVGTRYCSNNCPYKVRRFNFLLYADYDTESLKLMRNPDVSIRSRGVMEKCSYCIQRIQEAKITADKAGRALQDGEVITACQQACPTSAIIFGNVNDPDSKVSKQKAQERNYAVLGGLNYRPRTTYVAGVINPNPALSAEEAEG